MAKNDPRLPGLLLAREFIAGLTMMSGQVVQTDIVKNLDSLIADVKKLRAPRRHRSQWDGKCPGCDKTCEAPELCWPDNRCFYAGTDDPLELKPRSK